MDKTDWRKHILKKRNALAQELRVQYSKKILENLIQTDVFKNALNVLTYYQMGSEVLTTPVMDYATSCGKNIYLPVAPPKAAMYFLPLKDTQDLVKSPFGVLEPAGQKENAFIPDAEAVLLVPGLAFDETGNRIGYGAGYYDRFFIKHNGIKIGLCYELQMIDNVPGDPWDAQMDYIITEKRILSL